MHPRRAAVQAHDRPRRRRSGGSASAPSSALLDRGLAPLAAGQLAAGQAGQQAGPAVRLSTHTTRGRRCAGGAPAASENSVGRRRVVLAAVDDLEDRPAGALVVAATAPTAAPHASASSDGTGDTSTHGTPARRARSTATSRACHVGRPLLLQGLVVLVEHDARRPGRATGAHAAARAPTTVAPAGAERPSPAGCSATGDAGPAQPGGQQPAAGDRRA